VLIKVKSVAATRRRFGNAPQWLIGQSYDVEYDETFGVYSASTNHGPLHLDPEDVSEQQNPLLKGESEADK